MTIPTVQKQDLPRINELIDAGTHFRCNACDFTIPVDYLAPDKLHCIDCYLVIHEKDFPIDDGTQPGELSVSKILDGELMVRKRGRGRPRKELPPVIGTEKSCRQEAEELGISAATVSRRRKEEKEKAGVE